MERRERASARAFNTAEPSKGPTQARGGRRWVGKNEQQQQQHQQHLSFDHDDDKDRTRSSSSS